MIDEEAYLDELAVLLSDDRVDRAMGFSDGLGREVRVVGLAIVHEREWPELEATLAIEVPGQPWLTPSLRVKVPFEPGWLELSGYLRPTDLAPHLVRRIWRVVGEAQDRGGTDPSDPADSEARVDAAPPAEDLWPRLLEELAERGDVSEVAPGRLTVVRPDGSVLTVLVTPDQWRRVWALRPPPRDPADDFGPSISVSRSRDDPFLVHLDDRLHSSVREELPPVSGFTADSVRGRDWLRANPDADIRFVTYDAAGDVADELRPPPR